MAPRIQSTKILFFGTSEFGIPVLGAIRKLSGFKITGCITAPDRPKGRNAKIVSSPIKEWAKNHAVSVFQPINIKNEEILSEIKQMAPDIILVAAYGQIIPREVLDIPPLRAINIHPSLLPRWRGASPVPFTILEGDEKTGTTLMQMDEKMDHGPIISQREITLRGSETTPELLKTLSELSRDLITETLPKWKKEQWAPRPQAHAEATYSKLLSREDGRITWDESAQQIARQVRAFTPWPGSFTEWQQQSGELLKISILEATVKEESTGNAYGTASVIQDKKIAIETGKGQLVIAKLKPEGKNEMTSKEFLNGYPAFANATLV